LADECIADFFAADADVDFFTVFAMVFIGVFLGLAEEVLFTGFLAAVLIAGLAGFFCDLTHWFFYGFFIRYFFCRCFFGDLFFCYRFFGAVFFSAGFFAAAFLMGAFLATGFSGAGFFAVVFWKRFLPGLLSSVRSLWPLHNPL